MPAVAPLPGLTLSPFVTGHMVERGWKAMDKEVRNGRSVSVTLPKFNLCTGLSQLDFEDPVFHLV